MFAGGMNFKEESSTLGVVTLLKLLFEDLDIFK